MSGDAKERRSSAALAHPSEAPDDISSMGKGSHELHSDAPLHSGGLGSGIGPVESLGVLVRVRTSRAYRRNRYDMCADDSAQAARGNRLANTPLLRWAFASALIHRSA